MKRPLGSPATDLLAIARPCYGIALLLVLVPLMDLAPRLRPVQWDDASWRFGAYGLLTKVLVTPLLGCMLAAGTALVAADRRLARTIGAILMATGALLLLASVPFVLDAVQVRSMADPDQRPELDVSAIGALIAGLLGSTTAGWAGRAVVRVAAHADAIERRRQADADPGKDLMVGTRRSPD